ncbi:hypothetical protein K443DRAFT_593773, partial [Laccaria amethystina LaAM-08-1]
LRIVHGKESVTHASYGRWNVKNPGYLLTVPYCPSRAARIGERPIPTMPDERWRTFGNTWDWDSFAVLNALWEREIARMESGGGGCLGSGFAEPDAHTEL